MKNHFFEYVLFYTLFVLCFVNKSSLSRSNITHSKSSKLYLLHLFEGDICQRGFGSEPDYKCVKSVHCEPLIESIKSKSYLDICSFDGLHPIVCCPMAIGETSKPNVTIVNKSSLDRNPNNNSAVEMCQYYSKLQFPKTERHRTTVMQDTIAKPQEFPHMALLGYGVTTADRYDFKCGGSLISENWILTAAQCVKDELGTLANWARLGDLDVNSINDIAKPKDYRIVQHIVHPGFKRPMKYNDIALLRLETNVELSAFVRPICLNSDPLSNPTKLIATGWGSIDEGGPIRDSLSKVSLEDVPVKQCNDNFLLDEGLQFGILETMTCASPIKTGEDACMGFAGGPLQIQNNNSNTDTYTQFGITSFGRNCGIKGMPGVYTKVSKYINWIERTIWLND